MRGPGFKTDGTINSYSLRIFLLLGLIFLFTAFIIVRLFNIQVVYHDFYLTQAASQQGIKSTLAPNRGEIYLSSAQNDTAVLAATNLNMKLVFAVGKAMTESDMELAALKLAPILEMTQTDLLSKMKSGNQNYLALKRQLTDEAAQNIENLKLKGIYLEPEEVRYYPQKNLVSQIVGFLGYKDKSDQRVGQYGIEGKFDQALAGKPGIDSLGPDFGKSWLNFEGQDSVPVENGDNIYLTIDPAIQFKAQTVLADAVAKHKASGGSVLVLSPKTGKVLAMANYPDFDPNQYNKVEDHSVFNNSTIASDYEPGSVFKTITMAAGIGENKITPQSTYEDKGELVFDKYKIRNSDGKAHGIQTMTQTLDESLNTGAAYVENLVGSQKFKEYVQKFGFGQPVGVELPGEAKGDLDNLNKKGDIFFATASFGQGITVTPIQMVQAYTAFANGGKMMKPYIVDKIVHPNGDIDKKNPTEVATVLDPKTAATVSAMLVDVVENGHGKKAGVKGYFIGGKTGTAQVAANDRAGYDPAKSIGSFIGFGPVDNPVFFDAC